MTLIDASLFSALIFFSLYGLAAAVECGIALSLLIDKANKSAALFTPLWELTNVFLVFGFTLLGMLFNNALPVLSRSLLSTLGIALIALVARASVVLTLFYLRPKSLPAVVLWLFGLLNFSVPVSFMAAGIYLLTGHLAWQTAVGWILLASAFLGLAAIGLLFVNRRAAKLQLPSQLILLVWLLFIGSILPLSVTHSDLHLTHWPFLALNFISIAGLFLIYLRMKRLIKLELWKLAAAIGLLVPFLLALANRPYLINSQLTLARAFGAQSFGAVIVAGSLIMLPLILLGLWLFMKLFNNLGNGTKEG